MRPVYNPTEKKIKKIKKYDLQNNLLLKGKIEKGVKYKNSNKKNIGFNWLTRQTQNWITQVNTLNSGTGSWTQLGLKLVYRLFFLRPQ